jgi:hypothetical protein
LALDIPEEIAKNLALVQEKSTLRALKPGKCLQEDLRGMLSSRFRKFTVNESIQLHVDNAPEQSPSTLPIPKFSVKSLPGKHFGDRSHGSITQTETRCKRDNNLASTIATLDESTKGLGGNVSAPPCADAVPSNGLLKGREGTESGPPIIVTVSDDERLDDSQVDFTPVPPQVKPPSPQAETFCETKIL